MRTGLKKQTWLEPQGTRLEHLFGSPSLPFTLNMFLAFI